MATFGRFFVELYPARSAPDVIECTYVSLGRVQLVQKAVASDILGNPSPDKGIEQLRRRKMLM